MSQVWNWSMSEEVRDQLGMQADWRYTGAKAVVAYCQREHIALERASVSMDGSGTPVLVGQMATPLTVDWDDGFEPVGSEHFPADCPTIGDSIRNVKWGVGFRTNDGLIVHIGDSDLFGTKAEAEERIARDKRSINMSDRKTRDYWVWHNQTPIEIQINPDGKRILPKGYRPSRAFFEWACAE